MRWLRRLYDWTISLAQTAHARWALFGVAFAESSFFPIPPDVLLIPLCLGRPRAALATALICTAGSVTGGMLGYLIGHAFFEAAGRPLLEFYHAMKHYDYLVQAYRHNAFWIVFIAAFTPIPYKAITITAGVAGIAFWPFVAVSFCGRGLRFFAVAVLLRFFGERVRVLIERHFEWLTVAFTVLLIGGFLVLKKLF